MELTIINGAMAFVKQAPQGVHVPSKRRRSKNLDRSGSFNDTIIPKPKPEKEPI